VPATFVAGIVIEGFATQVDLEALGFCTADRRRPVAQLATTCPWQGALSWNGKVSALGGFEGVEIFYNVQRNEEINYARPL
jgi:hypothetical protein